MAQQKTRPLATVGRNMPNTLQRSVAPCLRCGGIFSDECYKFSADIAKIMKIGHDHFGAVLMQVGQ